MKRLSFLTILPLFAIAIALCISSPAFADFTGVLAGDNNPFTVQNLKGIAPLKGAANCTTTVLTKGGTIATYSVKDSKDKRFLGMDWSSHKATDGTAIMVKRVLDSNTAYMPGSSGSLTIGRTTSFNTVAFKTFSNVSTSVSNGTYTVCTDWQ